MIGFQSAASMAKKHSKDKLHYLYNLVDNLIASGTISSQRVANVMKTVDRGEFCPGPGEYDDCPQPIGFNATISAPHMHALCMVSHIIKLFKPY